MVISIVDFGQNFDFMADYSKNERGILTCGLLHLLSNDPLYNLENFRLKNSKTTKILTFRYIIRILLTRLNKTWGATQGIEYPLCFFILLLAISSIFDLKSIFQKGLFVSLPLNQSGTLFLLILS